MLIRDRIKELRRVKAATLRPNPRNWRTHPTAQRDALRGLLAEIGYADALLARELPDGSLELIDGHLRAETTPEAEVPVLVLDLDDKEADKLLALLDPIGAMAGRDETMLAELTARIETDNAALRAALDELVGAGSIDGAGSAPETDECESRAEPRVPELYQVVVECRDEDEQRALYERLLGEGFACRLLNL